MTNLSRNPIYSLAIVLFRQCRVNGRNRKLAFEITREDVYQLLIAQKMRCAVTGLDFDTGPRKTAGRCRPYAASIDRIDAQAGYVSGNIRAVCVAVNAALGDWGDAVLHEIASAICARHGVNFSGERVSGVHERPSLRGKRYEINIRHEGKHHYFGSTTHLAEANARASSIKALLADGVGVEKARKFDGIYWPLPSISVPSCPAPSPMKNGVPAVGIEPTTNGLQKR